MAVVFYFARHGETLFNVQNRVQGWCDTALTSAGLYDAYKLGQGLAPVSFVGACASDAGRAQETLSVALEARENERMRRHRLKEAQGDGTPAAEECRGIVPEYWRPDRGALKQIDYPALSLTTSSAASAASAAIPVRTDTRLREWCFGDLEGEPALLMRNRLFDLFGDDIPREDQNRRLDEIANYLAMRDESRRAENFAAIAQRIQSFLEDCGRSVARRGGGNVLVVTHALLIRAIIFLYAYDRVGDSPKIANGSVTEVVWDDGAITVGLIGAEPDLVAGSAR